MARKKAKRKTYNPRCYESHKPLVIPTEDGDRFISGGNCGVVKVSEFDVIIGLDDYALRLKPPQPWHRPKTLVVDFSMPNMGTPASKKELEKMVRWLAKRVAKGQRVFVGCIGGHGRTGLILTALYAHMTGDENALEIVRETYCQKAVESFKQMEWLHSMYGVKVDFAIKRHKAKSKLQKASSRSKKWWKPENQPRQNGRSFASAIDGTDPFGRSIGRPLGRSAPSLIPDQWDDDDGEDLVEQRDDFFQN